MYVLVSIGSVFLSGLLFCLLTEWGFKNMDVLISVLGIVATSMCAVAAFLSWKSAERSAVCSERSISYQRLQSLMYLKDIYYEKLEVIREIHPSDISKSIKDTLTEEVHNLIIEVESQITKYHNALNKSEELHERSEDLLFRMQKAIDDAGINATIR